MNREVPGNNHNGPRGRIRLLHGGLIILFVAIALRLIQIQVIEAPRYRDIAQKQYQSRAVLPAIRGSLLDRNGSVIASNTMFVSFAADPKLAAEDARTIARTFSTVFGKSRERYLAKLRNDSRFVWLERQVHVDNLKKFDFEKLQGLVVLSEPKRLYHNGSLAGQVVGFTDVDNHGIAGLEHQFDEDLRGVDGYVVFQRDGLGNARPSVDYPRVEPTKGHSVKLTIDLALQSVAEEELRKGIEWNKADGGVVVMIRPRTGEILAIAQYPEVDPVKFGATPLQDQKIRAVTDMFEPGSVFKLATASAALENRIVTPSTRFFAENGAYVVPVAGRRPRTIRDVHEHGWLTFKEAIEVSSNIVMAKVSDLIGSERLYKTARDFGFGIATGVELPGEVKGVLKKPGEWSGTSLNTIAYGYEVAVTPLQIAAAYAAVANGGLLMKPYVAQQIIDAGGNVIREYQPQLIRRVVSASTARQITECLVSAVEHGTGEPARISDVRIAGKTGTSKKYVGGKYESGSYTASFVGFVPADDPQIVCLVMIDNPRGVSYYGGTTSAPVFRAIVGRIVTTSELFAPTATPHESVAAAGKPSGWGTPDRSMERSSQNERPSGTSGTSPTALTTVPDVRGCSVRQAVQKLVAKRLEPVVTGSGTVIGQTPAAGESVRSGIKITLICEPRPVRPLGLD